MKTVCLQGLLILGLTLFGCQLSADSQPSETLPIRLLQSNTNCGGSASAPQAVWIADQSRLREVYGRLKGPVSGGGAGGLPVVDFSREALVLIEMGRQMTGGYFLKLKSTQALVLDGAAQVELVWGTPAPGAIVTQVITSPCLLIALPQNGSYSRVQILDQKGRVRLTVAAG